MANPMFGYPIHSDNSNAVFSAGSWETALPLTNLADRRLAKLARSTDATEASTTFDVDLSVARFISMVAIPKHNLSLSATIRIYGDDAADFASPLYDSTAVSAFPNIYPAAMPTWIAAADRDLALTAEDWAAGYPVPFVHILSTATSARYWRVVISDTGNADGYVELGRLIVASAYQPTVGIATGAGLGWQTSSSRAETDGGAAFHVDRPRRRVFNFTLPVVDTDEALVHGFEIQRALGTSKQLYFVFDPADTVHMHRRSFLCVLENLSPLAMPYTSWVEQPMSLIEEL